MRHLSDIVLNQQALMLSATTPVNVACRRMHELQAGSVLVVDNDGRLSGIFTGRDVVHRIVAAGKDAETTKLAEVMTPDPVVLSPEKSAIEALRLMWDGGFRHVPVVDRDRLLGVVSREDFRGDEEERLEVERELWEHMR